MIPPLLVRASARHYRRHPWQFGLAGLGIALGVALAVGIDLAAASVRRAFALATEAVSGRATHAIVGGPRGLPEGLYRTLRVEQAMRGLSPFVGGPATIADRRGEVVQNVGIDPFADEGSRPQTAWRSPAVREALPALLTRPGAAVIWGTTAR